MFARPLVDRRAVTLGQLEGGEAAFGFGHASSLVAPPLDEKKGRSDVSSISKWSSTQRPAHAT